MRIMDQLKSVSISLETWRERWQYNSSQKSVEVILAVVVVVVAYSVLLSISHGYVLVVLREDSSPLMNVSESPAAAATRAS